MEQSTHFQHPASFKMRSEKENKFSIVSGNQLSTQRADLQENIHRRAHPSPGQCFHTWLDVPSAWDICVFYVHKIPVVSLRGDVSTCCKPTKGG